MMTISLWLDYPGHRAYTHCSVVRYYQKTADLRFMSSCLPVRQCGNFSRAWDLCVLGGCCAYAWSNDRPYS